MANLPSAPSAARLLEAYEPELRADLRVAPAGADDPAVVLAAADTLEGPARLLLDQVLTVTAAGEGVPDRLRERIVQDGRELWLVGALLPRATVTPGITVDPRRYASSCRVNPALRDYRPFARLAEATADASFPHSDARWDAIVAAAWFEANPGTLTQDGVLRRDVERRFADAHGDEGDADGRWGLALRYGRQAAVLRVSQGRLLGFPEAPLRPISDAAALCPDHASSACALALLRVARDAWIAWDALLTALDPVTLGVDAMVWPRALTTALDVLHRAALLDVAETPAGPIAFRRPVPRASIPPGFLLTSDGEVLVHVGELRPDAYGRLCRLAPFVEGGALRRHRLSREGAAADVAHGHTDTAGFLAENSRVGLPGHVRDLLAGWQRTATRITVLTGVDVLEHADGRLSVATGAPPGARTWDLAVQGRGQLLYRDGQLVLPAGVDALPARMLLKSLGPVQEQADGSRSVVPEVRAHASPERTISRLRTHLGGELPGDVEAMLLAGGGESVVEAVSAVVLRLPPRAAAALRRDRVLMPKLLRALGPEQVVVDADALPEIGARLRELGFTLGEPRG